ncbi:MAG: DegT/DnrJ/EryC1/StrS family aminotransferase [Tannerellaceae bacterium]|jgi:dTDP-4-amino-4,6-dideoxygalactose transaminase|nr:DegT/DnrJ/EryC1/StrS family aminotransferase [Tannerellaceae bacterium]
MKKIQITRSSMPGFEEYMEEIRGLWESCWLSNGGAKHLDFETALQTYLQTPHLSLFANGHVALEVAIDAFGFSKGGEVITTPYTHCSTTHSIVRNGLIPVFCDINDADKTIDAGQIEHYITDKTVAIIATHVYGFACDVETIDKLAQKYRLKVIYDAAHAFGVTINGVGIGNFGDAAMFSCHATKVFHTIEGGITTFKIPDMVRKVAPLINFGFVNAETVPFISTNARMNEFEAAMGICNLRHIDEEIAKRKLVADKYTELLSGIEGIKLLSPQKGVTQNYSYYPVFFDGYKHSRDEVQYLLKESEVYARKYFYPLTTELDCYAARYGASVANTPVAKQSADTVLALPLFSEMGLKDVEMICRIIIE